MRRIARRFGAALVFSEIVAAEPFSDGDPEASVRAEARASLLTRFSSSAAKRRLAETARRVVDAGADLIDINMGCPARRVSGALAGAALMRDLDHAERLIAVVVEAVSVPVTVKMRLGLDEAPGTRRSSPAGPNGRGADGDRSWADARPVLRRPRRLGRRSRRGRLGHDPGFVNGDCATLEDARSCSPSPAPRG